MPEIVLATLNAKYIHASFGLRCLMANLGELRARAHLLEFDINQRPLDIAEALLDQNPKIIGLGVYIWNTAPTAQVVAALKRIRPEIIIILGGPEISFETERQPLTQETDYVITGEADLAFANLCGSLLRGERPTAKIIQAPLPDFGRLALPYDEYTDEDIAHRVLYVEASRGCPFTCEFCLSSLETPVRQAPLADFLTHLQRLLDRGAQQFKFVDRTFNLHLPTAQALLEFCLKKHQPGYFYHFEMIPDRLPEGLRSIIEKFPPGALQFEVGIQSFNEAVCQLISRRQNLGRLEDNFHFLRNRTGVHIHADLIVGLPGESMASFGEGFDRLVALGPQEIQVGLLKRLRGTPIIRHDQEWAMTYNPHPPYEILQNKLISFGDMQRLRRFARYWDLIGNSGNFTETRTMLWTRNGVIRSPFQSFLRWSDWLFARVGRTDAIALARLANFLFQYLTEELNHEAPAVAEGIWRDFQAAGRREKPEFLRRFIPDRSGPAAPLPNQSLPKRQQRHAARNQ